MVELGQIALILSFMVAAYSTVVGFAGGMLNGRDLAASARWGFYSISPLLLLATSSLIYAFVTNDFSVKYVAENSNLAMPKAYAWVAFYSGNAGSLLYIAVAFSIMAGIATRIVNSKLPYTSPYALGVMSLVLLFFLAVILFLANPLDRHQIPLEDGQGMNPLLIHFGMFIHPPFQMLGLISVALPFSIAIGALLAGRGGRDEWVDQGRLWGMLSWLLLTTGLLLGAWWAYTILGWGGYWAWDPVENSALMPWLGMTAFVHSIMVQKRRGMFRMWNMVLIIVSFAMAQMGMFINRGGPVPSVHSFAESTMGWIFLAVMAATLFISLSIFIFRYDTLRSRSGLDSMISRESAFLAQNVLFLLIAFITLWGTIFPIFSEAVDDTTMTIGQPFFNKVNGPLMILLVLLMGIGPVLPWRKAGWTSVNKMLRAPFVVACGVLLLSLISGINQYWVLISFVVCSVPVTTVVQELVRGTRSRHSHGENWGLSFLSLLGANRPRYGGYIVHLSIVMLAIGITASSFYDVQKDVVMKPGDSEVLGKYTFTYIEVSEKSFPDRTEETAKFEVWSGDKYIGYMYPYRAVYPEFQIAATRGAIHSTIIEDFYLVPSEFMEDGQAVFRVLINPLVLWMWVSGPVLVLGTLVSISPNSRKHKKRVRLPSVNIDQNPLGMAN
ncbi:MAG TPA: cytochrome C biogenesis protein [Dehalococcoidia bacterium]|nr:cytochrome C biogenesis protein [Dehalococcoidia bacterium]|tara:strand:- start:1321 stop:3321 length:2001 start_codon:yes stop_codon:yes gene_type:complete